MDYSKFREAFTEGSAVSVNHKALITRALTKYPVDYALFRELLQNSADAQATSASIQFETSSSDTNVALIHQMPISRLRFSNNGLEFAKEDWNRLREIASGNPNETKIGAFGVGFYSVFELTDEPLVHSGNQVMTFRYKGVQLHYYFTEKAPCFQKGTLIDLPYKNQGQMPDLVKFIGFLVQSFLLVNLDEINLSVKYSGGHVAKLLQLKKTTEKPRPLNPPHSFQSRSPNRTLNMTAIRTSAVSVSLEYLNATQSPPLSMSKGLFSFGKQLVNSLVTSSGDPSEYSLVTCSLTKVDAVLDVSVSSSFRNKMIETLLKPPPKQAVMSLLSFSNASPNKNISEQLKAYMFPKDYNDAKIFIGFPTKQSTGLKSHLALNQVIPTLERTAIDMSNQFVKDWNGEMLYMAGVMARCAYENELALCQAKESDREEAQFIVSRFRFSSSAPDAIIGLHIKAGFWKCSNTTLVPTSLGIVPNSRARILGNVPKILRQTPIVTDSEFAAELKQMGLVHEVTISEIGADVASSPVDLELGTRFIAWLAQMWESFDATSRVTLLSALRVTAPGSSAPIDFGSLKWYHERSKLPDDEVANHLPPNCLSNALAAKIGSANLSSIGLVPLDLESWVSYRFSSESKNGLLSVAAEVLKVTSNSWSRLPTKSRNSLRVLFNTVPCIPTQRGLKLSSEAYVKTLKIFPHLPVVDARLELPRSWLVEIGLRESIDMAFVLQELNASKLKWSNEDLVSYLDENSSSLKSSDWTVLREGRFFAGDNVNGDLHRARDLYVPNNELRKLGLPTLQFRNWAAPSSFSAVLFKIGLRKHPAPKDLFLNVKTVTAATIALRYFIRNFEDANYSHKDISMLPVVPLLTEDVLAMPTECYRDVELVAFDEKVMSPAWEPAASRLGVRRRPKMRYLLEKVMSDPKHFLTDAGQAEAIFGYLSQHVGELGTSDFDLCKSAKFIPVRQFVKEKEIISFESPSAVFLSYDPTKSKFDGEDIMRPLLKTINPTRKSLPFLSAAGVSDRPSLLQVVELILQQPGRVFELLKASEAYEEILQSIESKWATISRNSDVVARMKTTPFLLGIKYSDTSNDDTKEPKGVVSLYSASQLVIVDDISVYHQFKNSTVSAPQDDSLESLYRRLGVPKLTEVLRECLTVGSPVTDEKARDSIQKRIDERLQLFTENTSKQVNPKFKGVTVELVQSLKVHRQLPPNASITTSTSAFLHPTHKNRLLVVSDRTFDWIDVASALVKLVLLRPDQDSVVVLEIQLTSSLDSLEKKGYSIERLRRKNGGYNNLEKKIPTLQLRDDEAPPTAPSQPRPQQLKGATSSPALQSPMPGAFPKERTPSISPQTPSTKSAESQNSRIEERTPKLEVKKPMNPVSALPPRKPYSGLRNKFQSFVSSIQGTGSSAEGTVPVDTQRQLKQGLQKAQPFSSSGLKAPQHVDTPSPLGNNCQAPEKTHELRSVGHTENGISIFQAPQSASPKQDEYLLGETLLVLCGVFNYSPSAVNIYRDSDVRTLAFNYNGSIFFNSCVVPDTESLMDYYYPIMAHELAHNLVSSHGASHSFYTESYIQWSLSNYVQAQAIKQTI